MMRMSETQRMAYLAGQPQNATLSPARQQGKTEAMRGHLDAIKSKPLDPFVLTQPDLQLVQAGHHVKVATFHVEPRRAPRINGASGRFTETAKRYYAWRDELVLAWRSQRYNGKPISPRIFTQFPCVLRFTFPLAVSLTKSEVARRAGMAHDFTPDVDNCVKAVLDTMLRDDDSGAWDLRGIKRWAVNPDHRGSITLYVGPEFV